eukprot:4839236-Pyramimonas_sp.AAC.2
MAESALSFSLSILIRRWCAYRHRRDIFWPDIAGVGGFHWRSGGLFGCRPHRALDGDLSVLRRTPL